MLTPSESLIRLILLPGVLLAACGCKPQVVQYRKKPAYYHQMASANFNEGVTEDGIEIRWEEPDQPDADAYEKAIGGQSFRIREEREDGTVVIRARIPRHVLVNTLNCLRNSEYQLLWDQGLAASTRSFYAQQEDGYQRYEEHLRKHRKDMAALLNRMVVGRTFGEVETQEADDGTIRCRLRKKIRPHFRFKEVLIVPEGKALKLLTIR